MKDMGQTLSPVVAFSETIAMELVDYVKALPNAYWYHRAKINSRPTKGNKDADYWFLGNGQMSLELRKYLSILAPTINGCKPREMIINKYEIGSYMPEHIDVALYSHNMVIPLSDEGDGITIEGVFHIDVPGSGVVMPMFSPPHEVPPVKSQRFTLIYLYD